MLVANKCDRADKVVEAEKGRALAEQHGLTFFETSAKSGQNVNEVFTHIAKVIVNEKMPTQTQDPSISGAGGFGKTGGNGSNRNGTGEAIRMGQPGNKGGSGQKNG